MSNIVEISRMFFQVVYNYVFILQLAAVSFSVVWVFYPWQKTGKSIAIAIIHMILFFVVGTILNLGLFILSHYWKWLTGLNFPIAWLVTIVLYLICFCKIKISCRIVMGATLYATIITVVEFATIFTRMLMFKHKNLDFDWLIILIDLCIIAFSLVMRRLSLEKYADMAWISVSMMLIVSFTGAGIVFFEIYERIQGSGLDYPFLSLVLFCNYVFIFVGYLMIYFHCKVRKERTMLVVEKKLLEADKQMLMISEHALEEIRLFRHDINNQFHVMQLMLAEGKMEELEEYLKSMYSMVGDSSLSIPYLNSGNSIIDSIINMEMIKAYSNGIRLTTRINVPSTLNMEKSDLCRILANMIDNAIEAILREKINNCLIDCIIHVINGYLYICVTNGISPDADAKKILSMETSKRDWANHGYGHKILKRIVEKYNGEVNYKIEECQFIAEAMLDLSER